MQDVKEGFRDSQSISGVDDHGAPLRTAGCDTDIGL